MTKYLLFLIKMGYLHNRIVTFLSILIIIFGVNGTKMISIYCYDKKVVLVKKLLNEKVE